MSYFSVRGERCENCHQAKQLRRCKECQYAFYCGDFCQSEDKNNHVLSGECEILKNRTPSNEMVRFILRFLLKLRIKKNGKIACLTDKVPWKENLRSFR